MNQVPAPTQLDDRERAFVDAIVSGAEQNQAVVDSGYSESNASAIAKRLMRSPQIIAALQLEVRRLLVSAAPAALRTILHLASDPLMHPKIRLDAAKTLLDRAGHIAPKAPSASKPGDVPLHEMTAEDLRRLADRLEDELAGRARPVEAPKAQGTPSQSVDILD